MKRFFVCRAYFKWKGKMHYKGDLLPIEFTHHDKARSIYGSRIGECEVEDKSAESSPLQVKTGGGEDIAPKRVEPSAKGTTKAAKSVFTKPLTGTPKH